MIDMPSEITTPRLVLRCYRPGDGPMYFAVARKNREHLREFEPDNTLMRLEDEDQAEQAVREMAAACGFHLEGSKSRLSIHRLELQPAPYRTFFVRLYVSG